MSDAPQSAVFRLESAKGLIELIAELPHKNTYETIIAAQHAALTLARARIAELEGALEQLEGLGLCESGCEGRCRACPADIIRATLRPATLSTGEG